VRILALGDSFTFGFGLPEKDTYVARLQDKLDATFGIDRTALLNGAISGAGTADELAFLEDFGDQIAPAAVFVFVSIDDFNRAQRSPLYRLRDSKTLDLDAANAPTSRLKKIIVPSEIYNFLIQHSHLAQLIRRLHLLFLSHYGAKSAAPEQLRPVNRHAAKSVGPELLKLANYSAAAGSEQPRIIDDSAAKFAGAEQPPPIIDSSPEQQRLARALFRRMKAWCDARGTKLAVILNGWRPYEWLGDLLASERIVAFDATPQILPVILRNRASYEIAGDGHPNAAGDALTADAVWPFVENFVKENNLLRKR
jgi:lysophospholipase L1-like esterase